MAAALRHHTHAPYVRKWVALAVLRLTHGASERTQAALDAHVREALQRRNAPSRSPHELPSAHPLCPRAPSAGVLGGHAAGGASAAGRAGAVAAVRQSTSVLPMHHHQQQASGRRGQVTRAEELAAVQRAAVMYAHLALRWFELHEQESQGLTQERAQGSPPAMAIQVNGATPSPLPLHLLGTRAGGRRQRDHSRQR